MNLQPIGDKVLIRPDAKATKHGQLFLPENGEYRPRYGTVLAVGPGKPTDRMFTEAEVIHVASRGCMREKEVLEEIEMLGLGSSYAPMSVKVGDRVAFSQYGTDGIETVDGEEVLIIKEDRILAVEYPDCPTVAEIEAVILKDDEARRDRRAYIERRGPSMIDRKPE